MCAVGSQVDVDESKEDISDAEKLSNNAQDSSTIKKTDKRPGVDHFNNETLDPSKTNAMSKLCFSKISDVIFSQHAHPASQSS